MFKEKMKVYIVILLCVCMLMGCGTAANTEGTDGINDTTTQNTEVVESEGSSLEVSTEESETETLETETPSTENSTTEVPSTEEPSTENSATETPSTENTSTDKPSNGNSNTQKPSTDKPSNGNSNTQKPSSGNSTNQTSSSSSKLSTLVKSIVADIIKQGMSEVEKAVAIHEYLTYNIDYDYENYLNNTIPNESHNAYGALTTKLAVCDGYAWSYYELAKEAGLTVKYVSGTANNGSGSGYQGHAWNQVKIDGAWYNVDACWDDGVWLGKDPADHSGNNYNYCLVSDDVIYKDHKPDSSDLEKCPKSIDPAKFASAIAKTNKDADMVYVANVSEIDAAVQNMLSAGKDKYSILMVNNGTEYWQDINIALGNTKKPLWVESYNPTSAVIEYKVSIKENVRCVETVSDVKSALDAYKGKWDQLELWYYNASLNDNNAAQLINEALYKTGYTVEVSSMTRVYEGKVECYIKEVSDALIVNSMNQLLDFTKQNGTNELLSRYIWYKTDDSNLDKVQNEMRDAFITEGYLIEHIDSFGAGSYADVIKFRVTNLRHVKYIADVQALKNYVNEVGLQGLIDKDFYIKNDGTTDPYVFINYMFMEAQYPVDFAYGDWGNVLSVTVDRIIENVYISVDKQDLKNDILDANSKNIIGDVCFQFVDKTGQYNEETLREMVESLGCGAVLDSHWYREGYYHELFIRVL